MPTWHFQEGILQLFLKKNSDKNDKNFARKGIVSDRPDDGALTTAFSMGLFLFFVLDQGDNEGKLVSRRQPFCLGKCPPGCDLVQPPHARTQSCSAPRRQFGRAFVSKTARRARTWAATAPRPTYLLLSLKRLSQRFSEGKPRFFRAWNNERATYESAVRRESLPEPCGRAGGGRRLWTTLANIQPLQWHPPGRNWWRI